MTHFKLIKKHVLEKLEGLPPYLTYHNVSHTLDVLKHAEILAYDEGITSVRDLILLKTGALYHDTGFLTTYNGHEERSCELAQQELPNFGFDPKEIEIICGLIRATKIPQNPQNVLENIICDADLDYLGRPDFYIIGNGLFKEFLHQGIVGNEMEWNQLQIGFLEKHSYFTKSCRSKREASKQKHLEEIRRKVTIAS
jgi:predicted metal-dependent HD superfamily phosphohydrolase